MKKSTIGNLQILLVALFSMACLSLGHAAGAICEVVILKMPPAARSVLEQQLKSATPSDATKALQTALAAPETIVEAVAAVPAQSGFRVWVKGGLSIEVTVTVAQNEPLIYIAADLEFEQRKIKIQNAEFRGGEIRLLAFETTPDAGGKQEIAVMRIVGNFDEAGF